MTLKIGTRLGHYRILALLGRGGMADVYRAEDERLGREVALKAIPPEFARDPERVERFQREVRAAAQLTHPHIVTVYEFGQDEGQHFYTMALMPGGDLKACIRAHPEGMRAAEVRAVAAAVARALDYAHGQGYVHRDVKPENILFWGDGTPQLTDFGIARAMGAGTRMTATGMSIGSPHYMSPEQVRDMEVDGRSDLYSLGVVLFEMLTGQLPFNAGDTLGVIYSHVNDPVPELPRHLEEWQAVVDRLLAKSPEDRYASAGELAKVLAAEVLPQARATRVMTARREVASTRRAGESVTREPAPPQRTGRLPAALGGAVLAVLVVGIGYLALRDTHAPRPGPLVGSGGGGQVRPAPTRRDLASTPEIPVDFARRQPTRPQRVTPPRDEGAAAEAALGLDRETRRMIQEGLAEKGFDPRGADGVFGPGTRAALRRWQRAEGKTVTGYLRNSTEVAILRAAAAAARATASVARARAEAARIRYGSLTLVLEPAAASVRLPDLEEGYRPGMRLREGTHRVVVRSEGYQEEVRTVDVSGDARVRIALERLSEEDVEAVKRYRKAAAQGHARGQNSLGFMYENGRGVAKDEREAVKWYRKAAAQGHARAQGNLGLMYANGRGVAKDDREAVSWYRKAAAQGHARGQNSLGFMYENGRGVAKDEREAVKWYRKAAAQGHATAQGNLGFMYANGRGVAKDDREAVSWYRKAAAQGHARGQNSLGFMYENGRGVAKDEREAVKWYRKAAARGHARAQGNLGLMYANGRGVAKDDREAVSWYRKAAAQGHARGQNSLGFMYENGRGVAKDEREAVKWYRKAAARGHARAQGNLGFMYANGRGVAKDDREAVSWYRKAAAQGHARGQNSLGFMYENGRGVAKDEREAVKWYRKAAAQGHARAKKRLAALGVN